MFVHQLFLFAWQTNFRIEPWNIVGFKPLLSIQFHTKRKKNLGFKKLSACHIIQCRKRILSFQTFRFRKINFDFFFSSVGSSHHTDLLWDLRITAIAFLKLQMRGQTARSSLGVCLCVRVFGVFFYSFFRLSCTKFMPHFSVEFNIFAH